MTKLRKNFIYNLIYQLLIIILPIITTPYLARRLGAESLGIHGYTLSIASYFILFGLFGTTLYGQREIAYVSKDKEKRSKVFFEIILLKLITMVISIFLFYLLFAINGEYHIYYKIMTLELIANALDISFFYQGMEEFKKLVIRNLVIKILSMVLIFTFVKEPSDLWIYTLILSGSILLGNLTLFLGLKKYIVKPKNIEIKKHLKPVLLLFIPQIATQIYTVLDKTMIGYILNDMESVGYYDQASKIVRIALTLITAIGTVMVSRISLNVGNKDKKQVMDYIDKSIDFVWLLGIAIMFGIIAVSNNFVPVFLGEGYDDVKLLLCLLSPLVMLIGLSNVTGMQYLIPNKEEKKYSISVFIGAIINVIFNVILINKIGSIGAVISSVLSELIILIVQFIYIEDIKFKNLFKSPIKRLISGFMMILVVILLENSLGPGLKTLIIQVISGALMYFSMLILLKDNLLLYIINTTCKLKWVDKKI